MSREDTSMKIEIDGREHPAQLRALAAMLLHLAEADPDGVTVKPPASVAVTPPTLENVTLTPAELKHPPAELKHPPAEPTRTLEEVRALFATLKDKKPITALFAEYGATNLKSIPTDKLDEIYSRGLALCEQQ
jgi:hypothetical protein